MITRTSDEGRSAIEAFESSVAHVYSNVITRPDGTTVQDPPSCGWGHVLRPGDMIDVPCAQPWYPYGSPPWRAHAASGCPGVALTFRQAWLAADLAWAEGGVVALSRQCTLVFTQRMFDALVSAAYNCGTGIVTASYPSGVAQQLIAGDKLAAARCLLEWWHPNNLARRQAEAARFLSADDGPILTWPEASRLLDAG